MPLNNRNIVSKLAACTLVSCMLVIYSCNGCNNNNSDVKTTDSTTTTTQDTTKMRTDSISADTSHPVIDTGKGDQNPPPRPH